ncbi:MULTISPECIES: hypothetical protein [unclassified Lactococcus]|uniref:hypothetical protein n=1 Tax=unclassified Lactococcus TaxID=2643510 RepID=UPI00142FE68B|nr:MULTISPECIES: hypothetical protein [unclassified Lactococcus]KAF6606853.1 hypothetical protein HFD74_11840 [Lactococcus sp. EKM201L]KAF6611552.1 hypothetical protein HFD15_12260 [Lactococcus sp. EKM203L]KAF6641678.1 hypothetical protein HFC73_07880 [Lactococcus sp. EKM501L]KAF6644599.1 hypothetical protein HFC72_08790 [Lactococcus sp. EKM502L]KAF6652107.1 hypothetical protein HFC74_06685 [Lactococcus sp. EKM101L]
MSIIKLHEQEENNEPKATVKQIIELIKKDFINSDADVEALITLISCGIDLLSETLGVSELSTSPQLIDENNTLKAQIQDLYALNDSIITADPNHVPKYTDGTIIKPSDLADMNINALDNIAELIGFELEE